MARSAKTGSGKPATLDETPATGTPDSALTAQTAADAAPTDAAVRATAASGDDAPHPASAADAQTASDGETVMDEAPLPAPQADSAPIEDAEIVAETPPSEAVVLRDETPPTAEPEPEAASQAGTSPQDSGAPEPPPAMPHPDPAPAPQVTVQKVGFFPVVLGGVIAAALGFGGAWYLQVQAQDPSLPGTVAALADRIAALEGQVATLPAPPDLGPLSADIAATRAAIDAATAPLGATLAALDARLTELERAPAADGTLADAAIASWEAEIDTLRAEIAAQEARMQGIADAAAERLALAQSTVAEIEEAATQNANRALQRAAITRIEAALDTGSAFDDILAELAGLGLDAPGSLADIAADGVPTLAQLQQSYPDAARGALAVARAEGLADDGSSPVMALLRSTLDVRSVAPRDGDDPDAILSRAEAALRDGRLVDALAELDSLPAVVRAEMTVWTQAATTRLSAIAAAEALSQSLKLN